MKFLKSLFTVPKGQKVTERLFKRVLISSVCGILLCMSCLMTTTWAWFTATIETGAFPIEMASHSAYVYVNGSTSPMGKTEQVKLEKAQDPVSVKVVFETDAEVNSASVSYTPNRFVIMAVYKDVSKLAEDGITAEIETEYVGTYCFAAALNDQSGEWAVELTLETGEDCTLAFTSAWQIPAGIAVSEMPEQGNFVVIEAKNTTDETTVPTSVPETSEPAPTESKPVESKPAESTLVESTPATSEAKTE